MDKNGGVKADGLLCWKNRPNAGWRIIRGGEV